MIASANVIESREEKAARIEAGLAHCTGGDELIRHFIRPIVYTEGMLFLAEQAGAFWLLDVIASHQHRPKIRHNQRLQEFQLWRIVVNPKDSTAVVTCHEDSDQPAVVRQRIPYTDFPLDRFECYVENNTILLKSEH